MNCMWKDDTTRMRKALDPIPNKKYPQPPGLTEQRAASPPTSFKRDHIVISHQTMYGTKISYHSACCPKRGTYGRHADNYLMECYSEMYLDFLPSMIVKKKNTPKTCIHHKQNEQYFGLIQSVFHKG